MKKLVIVTHPNFDNASNVNKRWVNELEKYSDEFIVHNLYKKYPNEIIDVKKEHELLESVDTIVFQFPLYWFSTPPLLKKWFDHVFEYGWAYGSKGKKMNGKNIAVAVTIGSPQDYYTGDKAIEKVLLPLKITSEFVGSNFLGVFAFYGITQQGVTTERLEDSVKNYLNFLRKI